MQTVSLTRAPGLTLYAFPDRFAGPGYSLADWTTHRVLLTEGTGANTGIYTAQLDETKSTLWWVFSGASQPANWWQRVAFFSLPGTDGNFRLTVTVTDSATSQPIENATVTLTRTGQRSTGETNASGVVNIGADAATWTYVIRAAGYAVKTGSVVITADQSLAVQLDPIVTTLSPIADACRITLVATRGIVAVQSRVLITSAGMAGRKDDRGFHDRAFDGQTDANGVLVVDLPWSSLPGVGKYRFQMFDVNSGVLIHDRTVTVPNTAAADYGDLV